MARFLTFGVFATLLCLGFGSDTSPMTTDETYDMESSTGAGDECSDGDYSFEYSTFTMTEGTNSVTYEECQFCICSSSGGSGLTYRCDSARSDQVFSKISNICELDCGYSEVEWSEDSCDCPSCMEVTDDGNDGSDGEDSNDDDSLYEDGTSESWDSEYDSYYSLVADFDISVTRVWNSRSDAWKILKKALREILENSEDYVENDVKLYVSYWEANIATTSATSSNTDGTDGEDNGTSDGTTDATDGSDDGTSDATDGATDGTTDGTTAADGSNSDTTQTRRRRRMLMRRLLETGTDGSESDNNGGEYDTVDDNNNGETNDDNGSDMDTSDDHDTDNESEEMTVNFVFSITLFDTEDVDGSNIDSWFNYLGDLASEYSTNYATNCESESSDYTTDGLGYGTVTVYSASLVSYDSNGDVDQSVTYSTEGGANQSNANLNHFMSVTIIFTVLMALVAF